MTGLFLAAGIALGLTAAFLPGFARSKGDWIERLERRPVVVHTKDERSIKGVLMHAHNDCLVLGHYRYLSATASDEPLPGEAVVLRANVSWIQRLPSAED